MATVSKWTPFGVALDITATGGTVTRTSATQFTVKINASWETYYSGASTNYGMTASSGGGSATINTFGDKASSGSGSFTGTYTITKNVAATKTITVTFKNFNTDNGNSATKTVSFSVSVPAWTSYTVSFNANGGSGAPGSQTKWKGQALTLSNTKPTRSNYSFLGWSTSASATSATWSAGGSYTTDASDTLYAVWKATTYTIKYDANGGLGAPSSQTKTYGKTLTLSSTKPTRSNYTFLGWSTSNTATTATYSAGGSYTSNSAATLYAVWSLDYTSPRIKYLTAKRCTSDGTFSDEGTYLYVQFSWYTDKADPTIKIFCKQSTVSDYGNGITYTKTGTSGTVTETITSFTLDVEKTYNVKVTVTDSGGSSSATKLITTYKYLLDFKAGGTGLAIMKVAELDNIMDVGCDSLYRKGLEIYGESDTGSKMSVFTPMNTYGNTIIGYGHYDIDNDGLGIGNTHIYGANIQFGVNTDGFKGTYKPYLTKGDSFSFTFRTAGYITNSGKDLSFWIPTSRPILGSPAVTITSSSGFILRQGSKYTHGSSATVSVNPTSYEATATYSTGIYVKAVFDNNTNVTNNDAIGIYWVGTVTLG